MSSCETCPFGDGDGWSEVAEQAINLGCVPSIPEIMDIKNSLNLNWGCHSAKPNEERICKGYVQFCKEHNIDYKDGDLLPYEKWYHEGVPAKDP